MTELFSVIVLLYNNGEYLYECLESVLMQDYPAIEIVVVDDGSKLYDGNSIKMFLESNKRSNIKNLIVYQNEKNLGTVKSANGAMKKSSGEYLKLLAADDALYDENSLAFAAKALQQSQNGIVTGDVMKCDENLTPLSNYKKKLTKKLNKLEPLDVFRHLCVHNDIVAGGVFFSKRFISQYGYCDESYRLVEDWPMWLLATQKGCRFLYSPFLAIRYRSNGGIGTSVNPLYMEDKRRVLRSIIIPAKKQLGFLWYVRARVSFKVINSRFLRQIYGRIFRREK